MSENEQERPDLSLLGEATEKKFEFSKQTQDEALAELEWGGMPTEFRASEAQIEEFYNIAYNMYRSGNYKDAVPILHLLMMGRPSEYKYVFALAACYHMLKQYETAVSYYVLCAVLDPKNPTPHYHEADCWTHLQEPSGTYLALYTGIQKAAASPKYYKLLDRMTSMQNQLKAELEEKANLGVTDFRGQAGKEEMGKLQEQLGDLQALEEMLKKSPEQ